MKIKVKMIQRPCVEVEAPDDATVSQLHEIIETMTNISKDRQRLIFQGKPLTNNGLLADYGLRDGFTIHLVERPLMNTFGGRDTTGLSSGSSHEASTATSDNVATGINAEVMNQINVDFHVHRTTPFQDPNHNLELVKRTVQNVLSSFPRSTSSTIAMVENSPREGAMSINVRIYGNNIHELDSDSRLRLIYAIDALYRCQRTFPLLNKLYKWIENICSDPINHELENGIMKLGQFVLELEEISKIPRSECVQNFVSDRNFLQTSSLVEVSDNSSNSSERRTIFRHPHGDSYGVVIVKMIEIQSEASVIFNKYSQIAFDIKCFEGLLKYIMIAFQEHVQRNMHRLAHAYHALSDISFDISSESYSSNLLSSGPNPAVHESTLVNLMIYFAPHDETRRTTAPSSHSFEELTRSSNAGATSLSSRLNAREERRNARSNSFITPILAGAYPLIASAPHTLDRTFNLPRPLLTPAVRQFQAAIPYILSNIPLQGHPVQSQEQFLAPRRPGQSSNMRLIHHTNVTTTFQPIPPFSSADSSGQNPPNFVYWIRRPSSVRAASNSGERTNDIGFSSNPSASLHGTQASVYNPDPLMQCHSRLRSAISSVRNSNEYESLISSILEILNRNCESVSDSVEMSDASRELASLLSRWNIVRGIVPETPNESLQPGERFAFFLEGVLRRTIYMMALSDPSVSLELNNAAGEFDTYESYVASTEIGQLHGEPPVDFEIEEVTFTNTEVMNRENEGRPRNRETQHMAHNVELSQEAPSNHSDERQVDSIQSNDERIQQARNIDVTSNAVAGNNRSRKRVAEKQDDAPTRSSSYSWKNILPEEWVPVIEIDQCRQLEKRESAGLSDAYLLSGLQIKKKDEKKNVIDSDNVMLCAVNEAIQETCRFSDMAAISDVELNNIAPETLDTLEAAFDYFLANRLRNDTDYEIEKFPELYALFQRKNSNY